MKIRFISDIHFYLNLQYSPAEFVDIMSKKEPADITLIAGDLNCSIEEALAFFQKYFENEKVIFVAGNHTLATYTVDNNQTVEEVAGLHKATFNKDTFDGKSIFLENDYMWLNDDIAVIGCCGWTDYKYHHNKMFTDLKDDQDRYLDQNGNLLPEDPTTKPEFRGKLKALWADESISLDEKDQKMTDLYRSITPGPSERVDTTFKNRVSEEIYNDYINWVESWSKRGKKEYTTEQYRRFNRSMALKCMNDFRYGKMPEIDFITKKHRNLHPKDCEKFHKESLKYIEKAYKEILEKNPNATIILMTHHPFVKDCVSIQYANSDLNGSFVSDHKNWLKKMPNIKYHCCGHVHQRCFKKTNNMQIIANPMGYLAYHENQDKPSFDINYILDI